MSAPLPRPSASSRAGTTGRIAARGKIAAATQRQKEREKLLAVVARSREPAIDKAHAHSRAAPATPSSVDRASRLSHRSAKKLKQPVIASISSVFVATPIPELPSIPEHHGTDKGEGHGEKLLDLEVLAESEETTTIAPAEQEETEDTCVCLPSMFDREAADWGYGRRKRLQNAFASFVFWVM